MRLLFTFLLFIMTAHAELPPPDSLQTILPKLDSLIQQTMQQKKIPGMAVAVVSKGKTIFMKAFGVRTLGQKAPVDLETVFQVGSVSKAITSTLVAILNRDQKIHLDHPIALIPGTTVRHILSHTTGMPSPGFNALIENGTPAKKIYEKLGRTDVSHQPGENFAYHNVVYNLITSIIECQVGVPFENALQIHLLEPLNMTHTSSTWEAFVAQENRVSAHVVEKTKCKRGKKDKNCKEIVRQAPYRKEYTNFPAAGGFSSNIKDMAKLLCALTGGRPDVISPQDLDQFIQPLIHTPDQWHRTNDHRDRITQTQYALGWRHITFADNPVVFHGGWIRGVHAVVAFLPEHQVGIVFLQNLESGSALWMTMQFLDWVLGMPAKQWVK